MHIQVSTRWRQLLWLIAAALAALPSPQAVAADPVMAAFANENNAAMTKMMAGMNMKSTGDIDRDFAGMMIAHHQGAIEMAQSQLRYGKNEALRRIAQEIIVDQLQEIAAMRMALGEPLPPTAPVPTQLAAPTPATAKHPSGHSNTPIKKP